MSSEIEEIWDEEEEDFGEVGEKPDIDVEALKEALEGKKVLKVEVSGYHCPCPWPVHDADITITLEDGTVVILNWFRYLKVNIQKGGEDEQ